MDVPELATREAYFLPQAIPENLPQSPKDDKKQPATMMLMENLMMQLAQTRKQLHLKDK